MRTAAIVTALLVACAPVEIPSTAPDDIATIVAATQRAAPTMTASPFVAPTEPPQATPTSTPLVGTPAAAERIRLVRGATSATIDGQIQPGETHAYVLGGAQAQPLIVELQSEAGDATLFMMSQGGTYFVRPGIATEWRGTLPQAGDYYYCVYGGATLSAYTLSLQQIQRIQFKPEQDMMTLAGLMPDGATATFSLFALKGAKLTVTLSGAGGKAALDISGFVDKHSYVAAASRKTTYEFEVPSTGDLIIAIVASVKQDIDYILDLKIE